MSVPILDSNHAAEALAFLTEQFKNAAVLRGFLTAESASVQELENVFWDIINKRLLNGSVTGDQEDQLGAIVGEPRNGRTDLDYLAAIILRIRVNRSNGRAVDIVDVAHLAMKGLTPAPLYFEFYPAAWLVEASNVPSPSTLAELLKDTKAIATYGNLDYTTWSDGADFSFSSVSSSSAGELGFSSVSDAAVGGKLIASVRI